MLRRTSMIGLVLAATVALVAPAAAPAGAAVTEGQMFTLEWEGGLYTVDPATGATTFVADTGLVGTTGLVWDAATSSLLAVGFDGPCDLSRIDPTTGVATLVGATGFDDCTGLDRNPADGTLWAVYDANAGSNLMTVDASTGAPHVVDSVQYQGTDLRLASLAWVGGTLYGFDYDGNLYSLSTTNAVATLVKSGVIDGPDVMGANVDCSGTLYATDDQDLYTIDIGAGTFDDIGAMFDGDLFTENLTVACGVTPPPPGPPPTTATPTPAPAPVTQAVVAAPRFTG